MTATTTLEHPSTTDIDAHSGTYVDAHLVDATTATAAADQKAAAAAEAARRERRGVNVAFGALVLGLVISLGGFAIVAWHDSVAANGPHGGPAYAAKLAAQTTAP